MTLTKADVEKQPWLGEQRAEVLAMVEAIDALLAECAELKELCAEHYQKAESAYSRGLDAGREDSNAVFAAAKLALRALRHSLDRHARKPVGPFRPVPCETITDAIDALRKAGVE
jgi:hypothetical protein